jgi:hypothetical protein
MIFTKAWLLAGIMSSVLAAASIRDAVASYYRVSETIEVTE